MNYGINAVMGEAEPLTGEKGHEVGVLFEVIADTQELANVICILLTFHRQLLFPVYPVCRKQFVHFRFLNFHQMIYGKYTGK